MDGLKGDRFGRFSLSREGLRARNALLYSLASERQMPLLITMGGGYHKDIQETVGASADVYLQAAEVWSNAQKVSTKLLRWVKMQSRFDSSNLLTVTCGGS